MQALQVARRLLLFPRDLRDVVLERLDPAPEPRAADHIDHYRDQEPQRNDAGQEAQEHREVVAHPCTPDLDSESPMSLRPAQPTRNTWAMLDVFLPPACAEDTKAHFGPGASAESFSRKLPGTFRSDSIFLYTLCVRDVHSVHIRS